MRNRCTLLITGIRFAQDSALNSNSLKDGEYFSVLFCRPLTRFSYVLTKAFVIAVGSLSTILSFLLVALLAQILMNAQKIEFIDGWQAVSLIANAWSFGCLLIFLRILPEKIGMLLFAFCIYGAVGTGLSFCLKLDSDLGRISTQGWEAAALIFHQLFYPAVDLQVIFQRSPISIVPIVTYISNILLYLLGATVILNKREFTYAQD